MKGIHSFNDCFLHGAHAGDRCPHPEHGPREGLPPHDWWRNVPCGHPADPVAWELPNGAFVCHCGGHLDPAEAVHDGVEAEAPGPIVPCIRCGCFVALPRRVEVPA